MANKPLKIRRGVTFKALINVSSAGVPSDLTGKTTVFHAVRVKVTRDLLALAINVAENENGSRFYYTNAGAGQSRVKIAAKDTLLFKEKDETYTWWIELRDGGDVDEIASGYFNITNP